ncbi:hypothetical protein HELRODRAFT_174190 [Helobdella robusta]|uniref:Uncharacterized protein n=1 Tax=Helobdella robusta TaxID=6412 RepID=T1F7R3_HELRO|nr:hypothetical protein HELRODRAFT_174190 [Helobdella robusta]ESO02775.1 hypothetical protein HELRODRAFT_174190 [Helobdella robusta]
MAWLKNVKAKAKDGSREKSFFSFFKTFLQLLRLRLLKLTYQAAVNRRMLQIMLLRQKKMGKLQIQTFCNIKRKGRPAKRKQQLFQQRKRTFEKLRPSAQDQLRLSWVLSEETAKNCVQTDCIASINDVKVIIDPRCPDDRANMSTLKQCFSNEAWTKLLKNKMWSIGENLYVCVVCGHHSGRDNQTRTSWVQCDGCINCSCVEMKRLPKGS